jgi:hypothetical protein
MDIQRPSSALSDVSSAITEVSIKTENTLVDLPPPAATLAATLQSRRAPSNYQTSSLKEGHEGRNRRRRYEMQNLLGCAQRVDPEPQDWEIRPTYVLKTIDWEVIRGADPDIVHQTMQKTRRFSQDQKVLPRALRNTLKRTNIDSAAIRAIESSLREAISPAEVESDYEVVEKPCLEGIRRNPVCIAINADTEAARSFGRYFVHCIAEFYQMRSFSQDLAGKRVATVDTLGKVLPKVWFSDLVPCSV